MNWWPKSSCSRCLAPLVTEWLSLWFSFFVWTARLNYTWDFEWGCFKICSVGTDRPNSLWNTHHSKNSGKMLYCPEAATRCKYRVTLHSSFWWVRNLWESNIRHRTWSHVLVGDSHGAAHLRSSRHLAAIKCIFIGCLLTHCLHAHVNHENGRQKKALKYKPYPLCFALRTVHRRRWLTRGTVMLHQHKLWQFGEFGCISEWLSSSQEAVLCIWTFWDYKPLGLVFTECLLTCTHVLNPESKPRICFHWTLLSLAAHWGQLRSGFLEVLMNKGSANKYEPNAKHAVHCMMCCLLRLIRHMTLIQW